MIKAQNIVVKILLPNVHFTFQYAWTAPARQDIITGRLAVPTLRDGKSGHIPACMKTRCYCAAIRAASRKATALYDQALEPVGLNLAQYSLMRRIEYAGSPSLTELGRLAELDRSTVGRNVRVLEKMGLARLAAAHDLRESAVCLTDAGAEALAAAAPLWDQAQQQIESTLGADGAKALRRLAAAL